MALRAGAGVAFLTVAMATTGLVVAIGLMQPDGSRIIEIDLGGPAPVRLLAGDVAPNFRLKTSDGQDTVELRQFRGKKPVALIFGSFT
jgi:hypothetical protein